MRNQEQDALNAWLEGLDRLKFGKACKEEELIGILKEVGLGPDELKQMEAKIDGHLQRGNGYRKFGRLADATEELRQAHRLAPWRLDILEALCSTLTEIWEKGGDKEIRQEAEDRVREHIALAPEHQGLYELLNRLAPDFTGAGAKPGQKCKRSSHRAYWILGALAATLVFGLLLWLLSSEAPVAQTQGHSVPGESVPSAQREQHPSGEEKRVAQPLFGEIPIAVHTDDFAELPGLEMDWSGSTCRLGKTYSACGLKLRLTNGTDRLIDHLNGVVSFYDSNGEWLMDETVDLVGVIHPSLRPGDRHVLHKRVKVQENTAHARLKLHRADHGPGGGPWDEPTPACVRWKVRQPAHVQLDVSQRDHNENTVSMKWTFQVTNTGATRIGELKMQALLLDADDNLLKEPNLLSQTTIASTILPPFEPGETRLIRSSQIVLRELRERFAHICLEVIAAN